MSKKKNDKVDRTCPVVVAQKNGVDVRCGEESMLFYDQCPEHFLTKHGKNSANATVALLDLIARK